MITVEDAFRKFKSRLELNEKEQKNASARHTEVREYLETKFNFDTHFLTGSYKRNTKSKPLKDIDIFFVLKASEKSKYRDKDPSIVLSDFETELVKEYGRAAIRGQSRSVNIDFGIVVDAEDNTDYRVLSVDAVPAYAYGNHYEIPDKDSGKWIKTNPKVHEDRAVAAHQAFSSEWKGIVRMMKYWNNNKKHGNDKPIKQSFLLEVMALQCVNPPWGGSFAREIQALFYTLADRISETWPDPAGLGPPVSDGMDVARKRRAKALLLAAGREADIAIDLVRKGRNGDALKAWRELFGVKFPLS